MTAFRFLLVVAYRCLGGACLGPEIHIPGLGVRACRRGFDRAYEKVMMGRTSIDPKRAPGIFAAMAMASSRVAASTK